MVNILEQSPIFIDPWNSRQASRTPYDLGAGDEFKSFLPNRRHSLAQETTILRNHYERQGSWSSMSSSGSAELFGSIWNSSTNNNSTTQGRFGDNRTIATSPSFYPISLFSAATTTPPSLARSFAPSQDSSTRPHRRFSLVPIAYETTQDHMNALSSVPEESLQPYRRHSVAGPLISSTIPSLHPTTLGATSNYQYPTTYSFGNSSSPSPNDPLPMSLGTTQSTYSASLTSMEEDEEQDTTKYDNKTWCMVEFKGGRAEIYHGRSFVRQEDWVIVEADRGQDLGKIVAKDLTWDQAQLLLPTTTPSPKQICRLATTSEITLLVTKRQDEQKALLICQSKSKQKNLLMDIVDAEYQWDRRKLTFILLLIEGLILENLSGICSRYTRQEFGCAR